jgi:AcrR family transcriptional regulator
MADEPGAVSTDPDSWTTRRRRPRDRKATIATNASDLFAQRGFNSVRMEDIAAATGISARALYRHYANKQALLSAIVNSSQARYLAALDDQEPAREGADASALMRHQLGLLAAASLDSTHFAVLWQREARHLAPEDRAGLRERLTDMARLIAARITERAPSLSAERAEIRAWVALAILSSPGHHDLTLPRPRFDEVLVATAYAAIDTAAYAAIDTAAHGASDADPGINPDHPTGAAGGTQLGSRREQLLRAAAEAFRRSGFQAVGTSEIGAMAGVAGPALYRYFDAKSDILVALISRHQEWVAHESIRALRSADQERPDEVLRRLVRGYLRVAVEAPDLVAVTVTEWLDLPEKDAERLVRIRNDHDAEWVHWLVKHRTDLERPEALVLVRIAAILIDDTVRIAHLHEFPGLARELEELAMSVLLRSSWDRTDRTRNVS